MSGVVPIKSIIPFLSITPRVQRLRTAAMLWLTNRTVRPSPLLTSCILPMAFFWNSASPTARTSSTTRISGSRWAAMAKPRRTIIPEEYRLTGVSTYFATPAKSTISSNLLLISVLVIPMIEPFIKIFSRPVISG